MKLTHFGVTFSNITEAVNVTEIKYIELFQFHSIKRREKRKFLFKIFNKNINHWIILLLAVSIVSLLLSPLRWEYICSYNIERCHIQTTHMSVFIVFGFENPSCIRV